MSICKTRPSPTRRTRWWRNGVLLGALLALGITTSAQVTIPGANTNNGSVNDPFGCFFGFERSAMIYTPAEIAGTGSITAVGFYVNSVSTPSNATDVRIYMKERNTLFTATSTYATETTGATLVYGPTTISGASLTAGQWYTVTLSTPFNYTGGANNLEVIVETNFGGGGGESGTGKQFRYTTQASNQFYQNWNADTSAPTGNGTRSTSRPNIQLTGIVVPPCTLPPSGVSLTSFTSTSANFSWTAGGSPANVGYEWELRSSGAAGSGATGLVASGAPGTGVTTASSGNILTPNTSYNFYVRGACTGPTFSPWTAAVPVYTGYCISTSTASGTYVSNFTTTGAPTNITNASGAWSATGYGDFTAQSVSQSANLAVNFSAAFVGTTLGFAIWVDWNNDLDFADAGETVYNTAAYVSSAASSFIIPNGTAVGNYRMRIRADFNASSPAACANIARGETEDYTLTVIPPPSCAAPTAVNTPNVSYDGATIAWTCASCTGSYIVEYGLTGFTPGTGASAGVGGTIWTGAPVAGSPVTLTGLSSLTGYTVHVRQDCGVNGYSLNAQTSFTTLCSPLVAPIAENFASGTGTTPPSCWTNPLLSGGERWAFATTPLTGNYPSPVNDPTSGNTRVAWIDASSDVLVNELTTPYIDRSALTSTTAGFKFLSNNTNNAILHTITMDVWNGTAWVNMITYSGNNAAWIPLEAVVPGGIPTITRFRIVAVRNPAGTTADYFYNDLFVDDFFVAETPSCFAVTGVGATAGLNNANVSWTCAGCTGTYIVEYGAPGFTPGTGATAGVGGTIWTGAPVAGSPVTITGLAASTGYAVHVRQDCGVGGFSANTLGSFTTQTPGQIGTGTATNTLLPINTCFGNNYSQQIYLASEYNTPANSYITSVRFYYDNGGTTVANWSNWTVFMANTSKSAFTSTTDWEPFANLTQVFSGTVNPVAGNWMEVTLTTPFLWDGTSNILVAVDENLNSFSCTAAWRSYTASGARGLIYYSDGTNPDPASPPASTITPTSTLAQVQFGGTTPPSCFPPSGLALVSSSLTSLSASWTAQGNGVDYNWEVRTSGAGGSGASGRVDFGTTAGTNFSTGVALASNTNHFVYVQTNCGVDGTSTWAGPLNVFTGYCTPNAATLDPGGITNVVFSNVENPTGPDNEAGGYADYTSAIGAVTAGQVVPVTITYETGFVYGTTIWVDWDNDLTFEPSEQMFTGLTASNAIPSVLNASITVPGGQAVGNYRMRIYGADFNAPTGPCVSESYIAVEDYTIAVCATATATIQVNNDCAEDEYSLEFTASSLSSGTVVYTVDGGAPQIATLIGVGTLIGPFSDTSVVAVTVVDGLCSTFIGSYYSTCPRELVCGAAPTIVSYCYENNDTRTWTFENTEVGGTVALKFLSGSMESNDNVSFWNGLPNTTPATPATGTGSLTSLGVINSTGNILSMSISSGASNSCADGGAGLGAGWQFQVRCGGCSEPVGFLSVDENEVGQPTIDCSVAPGSFNAFLFVEDFGVDAVTSLPPTTVGYRLFVNNTLTATVTGLTVDSFPDWRNIGTFPVGSVIGVELLHGGQSACNIELTDVTVPYSACPPANDACATATELTINTLANCPANATVGTTLGADQSGDAPTCQAGVQDVWYMVNTTGFATPRLSITDGSSEVVGVQIFNDCLTPQGYCSADLTAFSFLNLNLAQGIYYIRVFTTVANAGTFSICVSSPGPAGYECDGAVSIPSLPVTDQAMACTSEPAPGLLNSTTVPTVCGGSVSYTNGQEALYTFTPTLSGEHTISYTGQTWTAIFVYEGACPTNNGVCVGGYSDTGSEKSLTVTLAAGTTYYLWFDTWPAPDSPCPGTFSISVPCSGTPAPGNTISSGGTVVCEGRSFTLSLQNDVSGGGISYQWESSTDGGANWNPDGPTTATWTTSITTATQFRAVVTCASSGFSGTSTPVSLTLDALANCPCLPVTTYGCADGDVIARVILNTLDNNSGTGCPSDPVPGNTSIAGGEGPGYSDYTGNLALTTSLQAGSSYTCTVFAGQYSEGYAAWIDYNDDGQFDNLTERIGYSAGQVTGSGQVGVLGSSASFPIVLGCDPPEGQHRLRVRAMFATNGIDVTACGDNAFGEVEDYFITVLPPPACPSPSGTVASNITASSADLDWVIGCTETDWEVEYGPVGFVLGTGLTEPATGTPELSLSGLFAGVNYSVYVRANCGVDGLSAPFGPYNFRTSPVNDDCLSAAVLTVNTGVACTAQTAGTIQSATASSDVLTPCLGAADDDVWYQFVATTSTHTITLNNVAGSTTDLNHAVYSGVCGSLVNLYCSEPNNSIATDLLVGETYLVRVYSATATTGQNTTFNICVATPPPAPLNDNPCGAIALTPNTVCSFSTYTTEWATATNGPPAPGCANYVGGDVWFTTVVPSNGTLRFDSNTGVITDAGMAIYSSSNNTCSGTFTLIECDDDDSANGNMSRIDRTGLTPGATIFIRFWEYGNDAPGTFQICVRTPPPPPANDNCAGAVSLVVNTGLTCAVQTAGTLESATDSGVPVTPCTGGVDDDVWYSFVAGSTQQIITLSSVTPTTAMRMQLFGGACGALTHVSCGTVDSYTTPNTLVVGNTYYVRVYSNVATAQTTTFNICVTTPPVGPPANDNCAGATALTVNAGQACTSQTFGTVFGATASGLAVAPCTGTADDDVWYSFVATGNAHTVSLSGVAGSSTSMNFGVYSGTCAGTLTSIGCGATGTAPTQTVINLTAGSTYFVRVYTNTATANQNTTFNVCVTSPPANDLCGNAIALSCNSVVTGTTTGATDVGEPATCGTYTNNASRGVWYTVQGWGGPMTASLCGSSYDTQVAILTGSCGTFTCVAGDDDGCGGIGVPSRVTWTSVLGTTYYVYVTGWSTASGNFTLATTCGSTTLPCTANGLNLEFQNAANANQITWEIQNEAGTATVLSGADPIPSNAIGTQGLCLPDGCYRLRILDSGGDGMVGGTNWSVGGYTLRTAGTNQKIIDNQYNFNGVFNGSLSAIANGGTFCLPLGTDRPIFTSCDKLDWVANKFIVATPNADVTAQFGVTNNSSGYEFWFFDPNGSYSFRRFRNHATSDGAGTGATRACHLRVNGWVNGVTTPHLPLNTLLNVRVRGRVAGVNQAFGPACLFKMDAARAACPFTKLQDNPADADYSCGTTKNFGGANSALNKIVAVAPQPVPTVASTSVRYQFRFRIPGEYPNPGSCIVRPVQTSPTLYMNWASGDKLKCNTQYDVEVRVSLNGGATWCVASSDPTCATPQSIVTWGKVCRVNIQSSTFCPAEAQGGASNLATGATGELTMYPNPNRGDQLFVSLSQVEEGVNTVNVDIFDMAGKRVMARTIAAQDGSLKTNIELNGDLAGGMYMVNITAGDKTYTERLVIQP